MSLQREPDLHSRVLVFLPRDDWEELGEDARYSRTDPFYPHYSDMEPGCPDDDERSKVPHTWMGRVECILAGHVFEGFLDGKPPALPPRDGRDLEPAVAYRRLCHATTCFAIITAEGQWIECYEAEASVLLREEGGVLHPVNPEGQLTRLQVKWRHYVAEFAREHPDQVIEHARPLARRTPQRHRCYWLIGREPVRALGERQLGLEIKARDCGRRPGVRQSRALCSRGCYRI